MKLYSQTGFISFFDADFCNTVTVASNSFTDKTLEDCLNIINEYLIKSGFSGELLTVGQLKGIGNDEFDLKKIIVREEFKISIRFNNFE